MSPADHMLWMSASLVGPEHLHAMACVEDAVCFRVMIWRENKKGSARWTQVSLLPSTRHSRLPKHVKHIIQNNLPIGKSPPRYPHPSNRLACTSPPHLPRRSRLIPLRQRLLPYPRTQAQEGSQDRSRFCSSRSPRYASPRLIFPHDAVELRKTRPRSLRHRSHLVGPLRLLPKLHNLPISHSNPPSCRLTLPSDLSIPSRRTIVRTSLQPRRRTRSARTARYS